MIIEIKIKLSRKPVTAVYSSLFYKQDIVNKSTTYLTGSFGKRKKATFFDVFLLLLQLIAENQQVPGLLRAFFWRATLLTFFCNDFLPVYASIWQNCKKP
jgi:hypothetical protein